MILGIMGDSHDSLKHLRRAIDVFDSENVDYVLHTGDIISPFALKELGGLGRRLVVTFGNNDGERLALRDLITSVGARLIWPKVFFELEGRKIALLHGEDEELVKAVAKSAEARLVAYGHSHMASIRTKGSTLIVNPGETCGYLCDRATVAVVDLTRKKGRVVEL